MITRNDDPPDDPGQEAAAMREEAIAEEVTFIFEPAITQLIELMVKKVEAAYADGYAAGRADEAELRSEELEQTPGYSEGTS